MHCPEKWGYVQFATAEADFRPDPAVSTRNILHRIYYAQRDYMGKHGHWESDLSDLEIDAAAQMLVTQSGFEVIAQDNQGQK